MKGYLADFRLARAPMAALAMVGIFWGAFAGLMPDIKAQAGASDGQMGLLLMLSATGSMCSMFFSPRYFARAGHRALIGAGLILLVAFHLPIFATGLARLGLALLAMGATVGMLDICANIRISAIEARSGRGLMNVSHGMFSVAFGSAALMTGFAREAGLGPSQILPAMAGASALLLILAIERPANWDAPDDGSDPAPARPFGNFWPVVVLTALVLFASFIGENSTEAWAALHIERTLGAEIGHGSFGPAVLGFVMAFGRFFGQVAANRIGERRLIVWSAILGVLGAVLIAVAWTPDVVLAGVAVVALGMAVIVPSANTVMGRRVPVRLQGLALSRAWMVGMTGFFIGPAMMGLVAEYTSLRVSYGVMALVVALIIPAMLALGRIPLADRQVRPG